MRAHLNRYPLNLLHTMLNLPHPEKLESFACFDDDWLSEKQGGSDRKLANSILNECPICAGFVSTLAMVIQFYRCCVAVTAKKKPLKHLIFLRS